MTIKTRASGYCVAISTLWLQVCPACAESRWLVEVVMVSSQIIEARLDLARVVLGLGLGEGEDVDVHLQT